MTGQAQEGITGPVLVLDDLGAGRLDLSALFIAPPGLTPPPVEAGGTTIAAEPLVAYPAGVVHRARFALPMEATSYRWNGTEYAVRGDLAGDLRIAFVSCNGEETGDLDRDGSERNAMWARLCEEHRRAPFALLLHGGDQIYADEATHGHPLSEDWPDAIPRDPSRADLADLREHLRARFFERYAALYRAPEFAWISARVPALMQWDDHDICDGWGSLRRSRTYSPVGQTLFEVAREACLAFQHAARDGDLPPRFADPAGGHIGWAVRTDGLRILAPDLRSERTRREVMGPGGWAMVEAEAQREAPGRTILVSSVPLLGPRLSLLEAAMVAVPRMQRYEDDLRDQWQSRAHRASWRRMLRRVLEICARPGHAVTAVSGEIHLATRATMRTGDGRLFHQLVASGIAHRAPPQGWARILGLLAAFGEAPLPDHPISVPKLPGMAVRYAAERNFLDLRRQGATWTARWHLETSGPTPDLPI